MFLRKFQLFFSPDDGNNSPTGELTKDGILDFLNADDDKEPDIIDLDDKPNKKETKEADKTEEESESKDDDDKDDEEKDPLEEIEEDLLEDDKEPTEEQLELVTPVRRKEILKKFPTLFKEFPYLEKAYYRDQQYTEILPTIDDAREAKEKSDILDNFETDLSSGNTEKMLQGLKNEDINGFHKLVDNYLDNLMKVDKDAYHHVIGNTVKHVIIDMVTESRRSGNEVLQNAAAILNQYVFGSTDFEPPTKLSKSDTTKSDPRISKFEQEKKEFETQRYTSANTDLSTRVDNSIKATIVANIDPKKSMTDYVRKNATREAQELIQSLMEKDSRLKTIVDQLWKKAKEANYSKDSLDKIRGAYLSKARTLLPAVIKKARNEGLKGMGKRVVSDKDIDTDDDNDDEKPTRRPEKHERSRSNSSSDKNKVPAGMSTLEYLMKD